MSKRSGFVNKHTGGSGKLENTTGGRALTSFDASRTNKKLSKFGRKVMKVLKETSEPNSFDVIQAAQGVDYGGLYVILSAVTVGNGDSNRTGDQLTPTSLEVRAQFVAGDSTNIVRFLIIRWNVDTTNEGCSLAQVLQGVNSTNAPLSALNRDSNRGKKFDVLLDKVIGLDTYNPQVCITELIKLNPQRKVSFYSSGTDGLGHLYAVCVSDSAAASHPTWQFDTRLNYFEEF